jgi:SSS family solute:Na+ symporter
VGAADFAIVLAYLAGMLGLGAAVSRHIASFRDYFVAGGRMTTPILVCTLVSTYYGLDVLFGASEVSYREGLVSWFVYLRPYYLTILMAAVFLARRLRRYDFLSLPDIGGHFYGRGTRAVMAVASFLYSLPILAIMGIGIVVDVTLGIPFAWGVLLGAVVSAAYTVLGGLLADSMTDTVQFVLMCLTLGIAAMLVLGEMGGIEALSERLEPRFFDPLGSYPPGILLVFAASALSALVEPAFYQRIFAAASYRAILAALLIGIVLWAAFDWVVTILGMAAAASGKSYEPRYALLSLVQEVLPAGLKGLFLAGVLATAMSTIDSYLLISGGNIAYDLYRPFARRALSDVELIGLTRGMVAISTLVTVVFALFFRTMVSAWIFMSTVLVASVLVPVLAALYLPKTATPAAGLASSAAGLVVSILYYVAVHAFGAFDQELATQVWTVTIGGNTVPLWQEYALLFALPASVVAYCLGSLLGRRRPV